MKRLEDARRRGVLALLEVLFSGAFAWALFGVTEAVSVLALGRRPLVLVPWGLFPFALAVRYFRWT